eukprot:TRINITY_DN1126_c0_g1_i2.p1 TRINITY_DN1126_c0_g1~~TRINITY_DN1126_c0_g1_i2.p1  ORF type:complete len:102 (-),score=16.24 TRINITY_DN1126_c0_g1_i2:77-382(-)
MGVGVLQECTIAGNFNLVLRDVLSMSSPGLVLVTDGDDCAKSPFDPTLLIYGPPLSCVEPVSSYTPILGLNTTTSPSCMMYINTGLPPFTVTSDGFIDTDI